MPIFQVTKNYREPVLAGDEEDALRVFENHWRDFSAQECDVEEIKDLPHADRLGYDLETMPWGGPEVTLNQYFEERERRLWETRVPHYVIKDEDVGERIDEVVDGYTMKYEITDDDVGRVIFRLADGRLVKETKEHRENRLAGGQSDRELALEIELADVREQARKLARRVEALDAR